MVGSALYTRSDLETVGMLLYMTCQQFGLVQQQRRYRSSELHISKVKNIELTLQFTKP